MINKTILCVDDDPISLGLLRSALENEYKLFFARNGTEALNAVSKHSIDLILLDVQMPDINGFVVAQRLKSNPETEHIPIIFITSLFEAHDEQLGFDAGGVDYITKPISSSVVRARIRIHLSLVRASKLEESYRDAMYMLGQAGHYNDTDTGAHIWRMAEYSYILALALGWDEENANLLRMAAPMHDTGKIGIPDTILRKPDKLNAEEWAIMQQHCVIGYEILSKSKAPVFQLAAEIALNHHEKWDGTGYPNGLAQQNIPASARIVAIADVFDALSMRRSYKEPWVLDRILVTLNEMAGRHLDKIYVDTFLNIMPEILDIQTKWNNYELSDTPK